MADSHKFQAPRGTRDFYPEDLAIRRHIEKVWREVSINHGFEEIEGPMFEHLDLYTVKSGEGIVNELFSFTRAGGETRYALRPEFTPTLARMYAARAKQLSPPTKWFVIPNHFRAERPQRGRLREFMQWNIDIIGDDSPRADVDIIACTVDILDRLGLTPDDVQIKINDRLLVNDILVSLGVAEANVEAMIQLLDKRDRLAPDTMAEKLEFLGLKPGFFTQFDDFAATYEDIRSTRGTMRQKKQRFVGMSRAMAVWEEIEQRKLTEWCEPFSMDIVRGLAYYTGTVFEVIAEGERAIAGGGRYDKLIGLVGGPPTPAVGIAMGDVVLRLVLEDHGLLEEARTYMPRPDVFVIAAKEERDDAATTLIADLRRAGRHVRHTYRATRNVGKLLGEAGKVRARYAIIIGDELADGNVALKDLDGGEQTSIALVDVQSELARRLAASPE